MHTMPTAVINTIASASVPLVNTVIRPICAGVTPDTPYTRARTAPPRQRAEAGRVTERGGPGDRADPQRDARHLRGDVAQADRIAGDEREDS